MIEFKRKNITNIIFNHVWFHPALHSSHRRSLQILKGFLDLYGLVSFNNVSCLDVIEVFNVEAALVA